MPQPAHDETPSRRQSFNEASRPNSSVGRVKTLKLAQRAQLRSPPVAEFKVVLVGSSNAGKTCLAYRYVCGGFRQSSSPTVGAAFNCVYEQAERDLHLKRLRKARNVKPSTQPPVKDNVKIGLWDTAGQEQFAELVPLYFRDAHAVILVVDSARRDGLVDAARWLQRVSQAAPANVLRYLALSKADLDEDDRWVNFADAMDFAAANSPGGAGPTAEDMSINASMTTNGRAASIATSVATTRSARLASASPIKVFEVSSVSGTGVQDLFTAIANDCYCRHQAKQATEAIASSAGGSGVARVNPGRDGGGKAQKRDKKCC